MNFFIADTHFGHEGIIRLCDRPYASQTEMDYSMITAWNKRVTWNDTVYIIGDLMYRCEDPHHILTHLNGKKRLIIGNHDGSWMSKVDVQKHFLSADLMLELSDGQRGLTLCHYPLLTWKREKKTYMIHGHIHNNTGADYWPLILERDHLLNAGADINGFAPVTFEELLNNNRRWKATHRNGQ